VLINSTTSTGWHNRNDDEEERYYVDFLGSSFAGSMEQQETDTRVDLEPVYS
jgi:hypothetical protein